MNNTLNTKSNFCNTIQKFYDPAIETVARLSKFNFKRKDTKTQSNRNLYNEAINVRRESRLFTIKADTLLNPTLQDNKHKNILQKIERHEYEHKTKFLKTNLENKLLTKQSNKASLIDEISQLDEEIARLKLDLDSLTNFDRYQNLDTLIVQMQSKVSNSMNMKQREMEEEEYYKAITLLQRGNMARRREGKLKLEEMNRLTEKRKKKKEQLESLRAEVRSIKAELNCVKMNLITYYHKLLKEGQDVRTEGLIWIIKEIYNLGSEVMLDYLPSFLDEGCIFFLFNYTKLDSELKHLIDDSKEYINQMKHQTSSKRFPSLKFSDNCENEDKIIKNVKGRLFITNNSSYSKDSNTKLSLKTAEKSYTNKTLDEDTKKIIQTISLYEKEQRELRSKIENLKRKEMNRLFKEFIYNNYAKRFNTNKRTVIAALIGEESLHHELHRQEMDEKSLRANQRKCQLFHMSSPFRLNEDSIEFPHVLNTIN